MAKLSDELIAEIFDLLRQLAKGIEEASAAGWYLFVGEASPLGESIW